MVKITKMGQLPSERIHALKCSKCKTEFECTEGEMTASPDQRDAGAKHINCPLCSNYCWTR